MTDLELASILRDFHDVGVEPNPCDLILGLGSYDLRVADHCAKLFHDGIAERIVFSGASGNWTRELWNEPEADVFARRATSLGVPDAAIWREPEATNIAENLQFTRRLLAERSVEVSSVTIVTKPNTLRRVSACLPLQWPDVQSRLSAPSMTLEEQVTRDRSLEALIDEMVGDLQRLLVYPSLGFTVEQSFPAEVLDAYYSLVERGYRAHLMKDQPLPIRSDIEG